MVIGMTYKRSESQYRSAPVSDLVGLTGRWIVRSWYYGHREPRIKLQEGRSIMRVRKGNMMFAFAVPKGIGLVKFSHILSWYFSENGRRCEVSGCGKNFIVRKKYG